MSDQNVADRITTICSRYDIVFIMETRDSTGSALNDLWTRLNKTDDWGLVQSAPIGRTSYKEQYVYFYRTEKAKLTSSYQSPDPQDIYEREPFSVEFQYWSVSHGEQRQVALLGLHAKPDDVPNELGKLPEVIKSVGGQFNSSDGVIALGDFNADCRYLSTQEMQTLDIFQSGSGFTSLIPSSADTTVSTHTDCAYDRVVVYGAQLNVQSAQVYDYRAAMNLDFYDAYDVSDHYPVEFELY